MKTISVRVDDATFERISDIASRCHKNRPEIVRESIQTRFEYEAWLEKAVEEAREDFRAGRTVSHEEAIAYMDKLIDEGKDHSKEEAGKALECAKNAVTHADDDLNNFGVSDWND